MVRPRWVSGLFGWAGGAKQPVIVKDSDRFSFQVSNGVERWIPVTCEFEKEKFNMSLSVEEVCTQSACQSDSEKDENDFQQKPVYGVDNTTRPSLCVHLPSDTLFEQDVSLGLSPCWPPFSLDPVDPWCHSQVSWLILCSFPRAESRSGFCLPCWVHRGHSAHYFPGTFVLIGVSGAQVCVMTQKRFAI